MSVPAIVAVCAVLELNVPSNAQVAPPNDDCSNPIVLPGPGLYPYDTTWATTGVEGQIMTPSGCGSSPLVQDIWFTFIPTTGGAVTITTCAHFSGPTYQTSKMRVYSGVGCPSAGAGLLCHTNVCSGSDGSYVIYPLPCGEPITIQLGNYENHPALVASGDLLIHQDNVPCPTTIVPFCRSSPFGGTCLGCGNNGYGDRGCGNSLSASGSRLQATGNPSILSDTLSFTATVIPGPGLFFQANGLLAAPVFFGDGMLCAGLGVTRLGVSFPSGLNAVYPGATGMQIHLAGGPTQAGDTKHYQCWYRDAAVFCTAETFNLTQGLSVTWGQ